MRKLNFGLWRSLAVILLVVVGLSLLAAGVSYGIAAYDVQNGLKVGRNGLQMGGSPNWNLFRINGISGQQYWTPTHTTGTAGTFNFATLTTGTGLNLYAPALTTGNALKIVADTDVVTTGKLINVQTGSDPTSPSSVWSVDAAGSTTTTGLKVGSGAILTNTDGTETLDATQSGYYIIATKADGATTITLPDPSASTVGVVYYIAQTANQALNVVPTTADGNSIVADGVATSDKVSIETASHKVGGGIQIVGISATQWLAMAWGGATMTVEAAD